MLPLASSPALIWPAFAQGLALSFGLIVAVGAQNAFILRQGLLREHVGAVVFFCAGVDALLIMVGVWGVAHALGGRPQWAVLLALAGAVFLAWYGWKALLRVCRPERLQVGPGGPGMSRGQALVQAAAFTLLNPHVYLDTVLLVGGVGAQQPVPLQAWFVAGASMASATWFVLLGYGARRLAPWFARPNAWRGLDGLIGVTMWVLSALMLQHALNGL